LAVTSLAPVLSVRPRPRRARSFVAALAGLRPANLGVVGPACSPPAAGGGGSDGGVTLAAPFVHRKHTSIFPVR
jgi:hypothetical protein